MPRRRPILSVTIKDCEIQTFRAGGPGGQSQNKTSTGVRILHRPSGAVGESREARGQLENKRRAFRRMAESDEMRSWIRMEAARRMGELSIEDKVKAAMAPSNLRVEVRDADGRWVTE